MVVFKWSTDYVDSSHPYRVGAPDAPVKVWLFRVIPGKYVTKLQIANWPDRLDIDSSPAHLAGAILGRPVVWAPDNNIYFAGDPVA